MKFIAMPGKFSFQHLTEADMGLLAARCRALGEISRLKLLLAVGQGEKNVTELIAATGLTQANVSKHLQILSASGFLIRRQRGIFVFYSASDSKFLKLCEACKAG